MGVHVAKYEKFSDMVLDFTLKLTFKELPIWARCDDTHL
jgi:hypothetical protein